jgi:bifunctional UDP-N-acetylglucosamine pyrophosphorylase / glucosamine-1-phosphate N-acetyltransferase
MTPRAPAAVILAAGRGARLRSDRPKVLHEAAGRPLLSWVVAAAREAGCAPLVVVVGHGGEAVRRELGEEGLVWVEQPHPRGTGDALARAAGQVPADSLLLVLSGDAPLVSASTLGELAAAAAGAWGALAVAELPEPGDLGRVLARGDGRLLRIVEAADASADERAVRRVNAGLYALPAPAIFDHLRRLAPDNAQGELYLTDAVTAAAATEAVALVDLADPDEALGVNTRADLARVHGRLLARAARRLMAEGVTLLAPDDATVEPGVRVGRDTVLHPGVSLLGHTRVGSGCTLHRGAWIRDSRLGDGVTVEPYSVLDGAEVGDGCRVGPFARLRPASVLLARARVGNFVEVKNARLGEGVKAGHLAYLGDAEVGAGSNLGAGVVTCNYDGEAKHRTEIGRGAFVGSDTMLVAPVKVGDGATTAAGSVVTKDVPPGALAVGRSRQRNVPGWAERRRKRSDGED